MKVSGKTWLKFWNDKNYWRECTCDYEVIYADGKIWDCGKTEIETVKIESGLVFDKYYKNEIDLVSFFKSWEKKQKKVFIFVEVEKDKIQEFKAIIKNFNGAKVCAK